MIQKPETDPIMTKYTPCDVKSLTALAGMSVRSLQMPADR
jgi:hypothetical protein